MQDYIRSLGKFTQSKGAFAFTTCGLYSENAMRVFYDLCETKNISLCGISSFKAPATDGVLILPKCKWVMNYEKDIAAKLKETIDEIQRFSTGKLNKIPRPILKWYTIFNYPNKFFGKRYKHNFFVSEQDCVRCGQCVKECIRKCILILRGTVVIENGNCEFCFKCIHHCPNSAISMSKRRRTRRRLDPVYYRKLEQQIQMELDKLN